MAQVFLKDKNPENKNNNTENIKTLKQNTENITLKTENIKHISGEIETTSLSSVRSTRGAVSSVEVSTEQLYKEAAKKIQTDEIYYIKVCLKGKKSPHRVEINVDIVLEEDSKHIFKYKSNMVNSTYKYEIFRDLLPGETGPCWNEINNLFDYHKGPLMFAGKLRNRRRYRDIPKGRIPNCAVAVTPDFTAHVYLGKHHYEIEMSEKDMTDKAKMFFMCEGSITNYVEPPAYDVEEL